MAALNMGGDSIRTSVLAGWPRPLGAAAYHGPVGEFVRAVSPHSEADPAALLLQLLATVGAALGTARYFRVEASRHHPRLFVALVGESSVARKGTAMDHVRAQFAAIDPQWVERIATGLSSGEGLIHHVRDGDEASEGVADKRLLVVEPELASTLRVMSRDGNTLSPTLRRAWDGDTLCILTRKDPIRATGAHIAIIGHITRTELQKALSSVECANGFANRWLWVCVRRSKLLPDGGSLEHAALAGFREALGEALIDARQGGEMLRDDRAARDLWHDVYPRLTDPPPGLVGSVLSRGAAQVMRIALIYALLDRSAWIDLEHLEAAIEVWRYCEESARYIFGYLTGEPTWDRVLRVLAERGELSRTAIMDALGRHLSREQLSDVRDALLDLKLIRVRSEGTNGRPRELWSPR